MSTSDVELKGRAVIASDAVLEVWLKLMVDEFEAVPSRPAWLARMQDDWRLQATAELGYGILPKLDEYLAGPGRRELLCDAARRVLARIRSFGDPIPPDTLNAVGSGKPESRFERPVPLAEFLEPAEDLLDLLEFADDAPRREARAWTADELERALVAHAAWVADQTSGERLILTDASLPGANFEGKDLYRAKIRRSDLRGANFARARLLRVELEDVRLVSAKFTNATLDSVELVRCNLELATFSQVSIVKSRFSQCQMQHAILEQATVAVLFRDAVLAGASLRGSRIKGTLNGDFRGSDFSNADLRGADFRQADLRSANFDGAILDRTAFKNVRVSGVTGVPFWAETLRGSEIDLSPAGDGSDRGTVDALRQRLGAGSRAGIWGSATHPDQYQAMRVDGEAEPYFVIERRSDHSDVVRVTSVKRVGETTRIMYEILEPRFGDPIAQHLLREVLLRSPLASEFGQIAQRIQYVNVANVTGTRS